MALLTLYDPASSNATRTLLRELGVVPNKLLGQNYLINGAVLDRIAASAELGEGDIVLEIGPGLGALTCRLVNQAAHVTAIEKDARFGEFLVERLRAPNMNMVVGDALKVEWPQLGLPESGVKVVANLPYSISKPMLRRLMEAWRPHLHSATIMVQKEVADRMLAKADTDAYGPMALMVQLHGTAKLVMNVAPGSFIPQPSVTSSVVRVIMRSEPAVAIRDEAYFWRVVRAAFGQRRKQIANTLRAVIAERDRLNAVLGSLGIDAQRRGETLSLTEFARLSDALLAAQELSGREDASLG